jgi:hypothetical protein
MGGYMPKGFVESIKGRCDIEERQKRMHRDMQPSSKVRMSCSG